MYLVIPAQKNNIFKLWLTFLNPILKLTDNELTLFATLISLYYAYRDYNPDTLYSLLFSPTTLSDVQKRLSMHTRVFNNSLQGLKDKGLIIDNTITKSITQHLTGKFKITIDFSLDNNN